MKKTGKSKKELESIWARATKEASGMGQGKNYAYITSIFKTMLGIEESTNIDDIINRFMESDESFDKFYETLTAGSIESGDIPDTLRYVKRPQESDEDEDEEGKEYDIVQASPKMRKKMGVKDINKK